MHDFFFILQKCVAIRVFVICDWRNENAEGIYEISRCFVAYFTIFAGLAFTFGIHWAQCWCQEPQHGTHTLLNPVYLSQKKSDTSGTSLSYPLSWWKVHWSQISFSYTQLHVGMKHTYDKPPSVVPHLQKPASSFPWQHDCCSVPATGVLERRVTLTAVMWLDRLHLSWWTWHVCPGMIELWWHSNVWTQTGPVTVLYNTGEN